MKKAITSVVAVALAAAAVPLQLLGEVTCAAADILGTAAWAVAKRSGLLERKP